MSNVSKVFSQKHYGLSTAAAMLYAIGWLVASRVHAEPSMNAFSTSAPMLAAVVVTAPRLTTERAMLDPIVVTANREKPVATYAMLSPVVVLASREVGAANDSATLPALLSTNVTGLSATDAGHTAKRKNLFTRVGHWFASSLIK